MSKAKQLLSSLFRLRSLWILLAVVLAAGTGLFAFGMHMPGSSHSGALPALVIRAASWPENFSVM